MKIAGIIAEYNPFHNGHAHHIAQTRRLSGCDYVAVCMSGSFTQRGEAACMDKWTRARIALNCGADAVFELPAMFAVRTADAFARGGVHILTALGCDCLSFGCETEDMELLRRLAALREDEPEALSQAVRLRLERGASHARARGEAVAEMLGVAPEQINAPNLILAAEYLRALAALGSSMQPVAVPRIGDYRDLALGTFASASAIRAAVDGGRMEEAMNCVPEVCRRELQNIRMHAPDDLLLHTLRRMTEAEVAALPDVGEGLERRLLRCARDAASRAELMDMLKCKRYTHARLSRLCAHAMLGMTQAMIQRNPAPTYARLIGMRADAQPMLRELKKRSALPMVSAGSEIDGSEIFQVECAATDLRALMCDGALERRAGQEYRAKFVRV